ncbi:glycosylphosphatidylinositol anchor biosynthesis [Coemansia sp. RSA 1807]|nr:glycosylphosphatidylinositol anchor biosynthesis [Coemansia sp. RSA 921]KAJ2148964.1 glycosylphosphatidylinositol anchor biosynthesis [Coemansia sp. RSA 564]KAJ2190600.1 glycosylphosphatidylinositol anchor biosynthesis [Coemansia sp. RSA 532]KAJ2198084.1 glycosylphosphatidylinositol anchor biosynthesis [Coemansia sp. RSA 522]KAJ2229359.1 glycosylphosphatidylinositol anchor biosynthesis [Coemansia sp. RSA 518]KAJ2278368.1 glycosylphosphatidylinositol anchor biosynthesis [Coemansia sp. RSA 37
MPTLLGVPFLGRRRETASEPPTSRESIHDAAGPQASPNAQAPNNFSSEFAGSVFPSRRAEILSAHLRGAASHEPLHTPASPTKVKSPDSATQRTAAFQHRRPWRKLLYIPQDFPDDYVDDTFLMELQKNANVRMYNYSTVVMQTTVVTQHISSIVVFIAVFINLYRGALTGNLLLWCSTVTTVIGIISWDLLCLTLRTPVQRIIRLGMIKSAVLFALLLFGLSPILRTLTGDTSSDTIWAMTVIFFFVNLAFHDYSTGNLTNIRFPGSVSLNAAVLGSVLLASQLDSNLSVFAFLTFALKWFALFPIFRRYLKRISAAASMVTTVVLALVATAMFMYISRAIAMLHVFSTLFITFGCPLWLIWVQRYKNEIHGPWDEARPIVHHYYH